MPRRSWSRWLIPGRQVQRFLALLLPWLLVLGPALVAAVPLGSAGVQGAPLMRQLPGPSPRQTLDNFLASTSVAEEQLQAVIHQGLADPGWFFSAAQREQAEAVRLRLEQATEALNLSQLPQVLHPITGVGYMLMLRSLLQYDLAQHPGLVVPGVEEVERGKIRSWTIPETPITLSLNLPQPEARGASAGLPCSQCGEDDFLFSPRTVTQVEPNFQRIFANDPSLRHRFGGDLYVHWALLPGGILPPKWLLRLPPPLRTLLEQPWWGQSLIQWLLLLVSSLPLLVKGSPLAGTVDSMGMRSIGLRLRDGSMVSIPNSHVASSVVSNHSLRSAEPLELRLPLPLLSSDVMAQLQARAQALMADTAGLQAAEVHLNHQDGGWWLQVSGRWSPELSRRELPSHLDGLYLALHGLIVSVDSRAQMGARA